MIIVGLTGSIGSGKTTVAKIVSDMGIALHDADEVVHHLLKVDQELLSKIAEKFPGVVDDTGQINRSKLGDQVFSDEKKLSELESLVYPRYDREVTKFLNENADKDIVFLDIPLLYEKGYNILCHEVVVLSCAEDIRKIRVLERADVTQQRLEEIDGLQMNTKDKAQRGDYVLATDTEIDITAKNIAAIIDNIKSKYKNA